VSRLRLFLASASPRRLDLLRQIGLDPQLLPTSVDERSLDGEPPRALAARLARAKGLAAAPRVAASSDAAEPVVLAADTIVVLGGEAIGKPSSPEHAARMLRSLRGRTHEVLTAVFLHRPASRGDLCEVESTSVTFGDIDDETIHAYVAGGEPLDKAGAYGLQGRGALFVTRIDGSWSNVVGLPVERLPGWFRRLGLDLLRDIAWS